MGDLGEYVLACPRKGADKFYKDIKRSKEKKQSFCDLLRREQGSRGKNYEILLQLVGGGRSGKQTKGRGNGTT